MPTAGTGIGFWVSGPPIEPADDAAWHLASEGLRRKFWGQVKGLAQEAYAAEREAGIGADGRRLARLSKRTIAHRRSEMGPADPAAPPLIPAHGMSRTISLLTGQATATGVWFRWKRFHRQSWGQILQWHANGEVQGAPARDVMGISPRGIQKIARQARAWWKEHRHQATPAQPITPTPKTPTPKGWTLGGFTPTRSGFGQFRPQPVARPGRPKPR